MALALYRKYRPATFAEVIGQEHVTEPLRIALAAGRINHAYLFSGPRGCGKTSSARILARSLNCEHGPTPDPCGVCASCIALAPEGPGSLDVVELDAASHGGVDDTRELRDRAFYMPAESRYRVFIIDEAHMVTTQGFNALLKIVEEPPEHLVFIFATTEPDKVLTTIRSRTHHYPFRLMAPTVMRGLLERLTAQEQVIVEPAVYPLVIQAGGGSARDTLSVLDQLLAGAGDAGVTYRQAVALLGVTDAALLDEMVDALAAGDGAAAFGAVDRVAEAGHDPRRFAADLLQRMRDLVILSVVPDAADKGLINAPADQLEAMQLQASRVGAATASRWAEVLHTGLIEMRGTTAPRLVLELMCSRMLLPAASLADGALLQRLERMERRLTIAGEDPGPGTGDGERADEPAPQVRRPAPARPAPAEQPSAGAGRAPGPSGSAPTPPAAVTPEAVAVTPDSPTPVRSAEPGPAAQAAAAASTPAAQPVPPAARAAGETAAAAPVRDSLGLPPPPPRGARPAAPVNPAEPDLGLPPPPPRRGSIQSAPAALGDAPGQVAAPGDRRQAPARPVAPPTGPAVAPAAAAASPGPAAGSHPSGPPAQSGVKSPDATDVRRLWREILDKVQKRRRTTQVLLESATVAELRGNTLLLAIASPALARRVEEPANADVLRAVLREILGVDWQIRCGAGTATAPAGGGPARGGRSATVNAGRDPHESAPPPPEPPDEDEIPDDYGSEPDPDAPPVVVRDPEEVAIELLTAQLGARRLEE